VTILFARASVPAWMIVLGIAAFLAPAGIATTVLVIAFGLACVPAVMRVGVWKRSLDEPSAEEMSVWHNAASRLGSRQAPRLGSGQDAIEAEFVAEDARKDSEAIV
jgi:hypothetical protein